MYDPVRCFGSKSDSIFAIVVIKLKSKPKISDARLISSRGVPVGTPFRDSKTISFAFDALFVVICLEIVNVSAPTVTPTRSLFYRLAAMRDELVIEEMVVR